MCPFYISPQVSARTRCTEKCKVYTCSDKLISTCILCRSTNLHHALLVLMFYTACDTAYSSAGWGNNNNNNNIESEYKRKKKDLNFEYFGGGIFIWLKHIWCCMRYQTQKL